MMTTPTPTSTRRAVDGAARDRNPSRALTVAATVPVVAAVLLMGSLADFGDSWSRTAYALGVATAVPAFLFADWVARR